MPNLKDIDPSDISLAPAHAVATPDASGNINNIHQDDIETQEEHFGSGIEQLKTGLEGAAEGVIGPLAPAVERAFGVKPEDIRMRRETNPISHGVGQVAGFAGSLLAPGLSEVGLGAQVTNIGEKAAALAPAVSGIAQIGIKASAEMAALASSDELSKLVEKDPNQTLGSAAINIGLSGIMGGAGGVALGAVSPLWTKTKNVLGVENLITDFMTETNALKEAANPSVVSWKDLVEPAEKAKATPGVSLARWVHEKGAEALGVAAGKGAAGAVGAGIGAVVGHPIAGAWMGEKILGPIFSAIAKPIAETAVDSAAAKGTVDYLANVLKGQRELDRSVGSLFIKEAEVIGKDLIPDQESRDKLEKSLDSFKNPENAASVGGGIGHYLPSHATAAAQTSATAANYLNALKPTQPVTNPLDVEPPVDKASQEKYNRALNIAQQPLMALKYAKDGTLLPEDVNTLQTIYPGLHSRMVQLVTNQLINNGGGKVKIPYSRRVSLNLLIGGAPLDASMTSPVMQAIMNSAVGAETPQTERPQGRQKQASGTTLSQVNKVSKLYQTPLEARQFDKRS